MKSSFLCAVLVATISSVGSAADITNRPTLTLEGAKHAVAAAVNYAKAHDAPGASIAVVDSGGHTIYLESLDGTFPAGSDISIGKARTAVAFKRATHGLEDTINKGRPAMIPVAGVTAFTPLQGGVPILVNGQIVGAIGCSGAASAQQDEEVATAGASALEAANSSTSSARGAGSARVTHIPAAAVEKSYSEGSTGGVIADGPGFTVNPSRRDTAGEAELHTYDSDIIYVLQGSATIVTGGNIVDAHEVKPGEIRGKSIEGGTVNEVAKGDVLTIPHGTPHWFKTVHTPFRYYTVKSGDSPENAS